MQEFIEEFNRTILRTLQAILLHLILGITPSSKSMRHAGEIDILIRHTQGRNNLIRILLELRRVLRIMLRGQNLDRNLDGINLRLIQKRGMSRGNGIDERGVGAQLEYSPATVAVANGSDLRVLCFQGLGGGFDFGPALGLAVAADEGGDIEGFTLRWVL